ncbi:MAG: cation-transporting P-type ATPase [Anaerolineales bacterium]|nr:cation-transporting P-type ATPase [Anaerolineales bacterium]
MANQFTHPRSWSQTQEELLPSLGSSRHGLEQNNAAQRLVDVGYNLLQEKEQSTPIKLFFNQFKSPIVLILLFATVVSIFVQEWIDVIIILAIVLGSAILGFYQEYSAKNTVEKLKAQDSLKSLVLRDRQKKEIPSEEIVPGDEVLLSAGSLIGLLLWGLRRREDLIHLADRIGNCWVKFRHREYQNQKTSDFLTGLFNAADLVVSAAILPRAGRLIPLNQFTTLLLAANCSVNKGGFCA